MCRDVYVRGQMRLRREVRGRVREALLDEVTIGNVAERVIKKVSVGQFAHLTCTSFVFISFPGTLSNVAGAAGCGIAPDDPRGRLR